MYCSKCGKEIPDDSKFCEHCGFQINSKNKVEPKNNEEKYNSNHHNIKKAVIVIFSIIIVITVVLGIIYYVNYSNELKRKDIAFNKIRQDLPGITMQELASMYNCSLKDLTSEKLEQIIAEHEQYLSEQKQYDKEYKSKIEEAKQQCIDKIEKEVLNNSLDGHKNDMLISYYPKELKSLENIFVALNTSNKTVSRLGMVVTYNASCYARSTTRRKKF